METGSRKWGQPYLNRGFFALIGESMAEDVMLIMARAEWTLDRRRDQLHRRGYLLGATGVPSSIIHFCILRSVIIRRSILRSSAIWPVEAGAQGEHKIARGYRPETTYSAHYIADPACDGPSQIICGANEPTWPRPDANSRGRTISKNCRAFLKVSALRRSHERL